MRDEHTVEPDQRRIMRQIQLEQVQLGATPIAEPDQSLVLRQIQRRDAGGHAQQSSQVQRGKAGAVSTLERGQCRARQYI